MNYSVNKNINSDEYWKEKYGDNSDKERKFWEMRYGDDAITQHALTEDEVKENKRAKKTLINMIFFVAMGVFFSLLLFQNLWLAYGIGFIIVIKINISWYQINWDEFISDKKWKICFIQWLLAYSFFFVSIIIPAAYAIDTKTDINLLSNKTEEYITNLNKDNEPEISCYAPAC